MPEFDWLSSEPFRREIEGRLRISAGEYGMRTYESAISDMIFGFAQLKREKNARQELIREASLRRGMPEAMDSVQKLVKSASATAMAAGRDNLTVEDIQRAYQENFCLIWPFC
jgi:hypothetical protein